MNTPTVYVLCDANCKWEGMTKEQILTAITQAVNEGTIGDIDTGFIQTIKTINGTPLKFFVGEQAEYNALSDEDKQNLFAIITNDATKDGILAALEELHANYEALVGQFGDLYNGLVYGDITVEEASNADNARAITTYTESADVELPILAAEVTNGQKRRLIRTGATYNPTTNTLTVGNVNGKATEDGNGNNIVDTYGNFSRSWQGSGLLEDTATLDGAGVYLFSVYIKDGYTEFKSSLCMYFDGVNRTTAILNIAHYSSDGIHYYAYGYRMSIGEDGTVRLQRIPLTSGEPTYSQLGNNINLGYMVAINYKKIF